MSISRYDAEFKQLVDSIVQNGEDGVNFYLESLFGHVSSVNYEKMIEDIWIWLIRQEYNKTYSIKISNDRYEFQYTGPEWVIIKSEIVEDVFMPGQGYDIRLYCDDRLVFVPSNYGKYKLSETRNIKFSKDFLKRANITYPEIYIEILEGGFYCIAFRDQRISSDRLQNNTFSISNDVFEKLPIAQRFKNEYWFLYGNKDRKEAILTLLPPTIMKKQTNRDFSSHKEFFVRNSGISIYLSDLATQANIDINLPIESIPVDNYILIRNRSNEIQVKEEITYIEL